MPAPFAQQIARLNVAVIGHLADVVAIWNATGISGAFDRLYFDALGVASNNPVFRALASTMVGVAIGQAIQINGINYTIVSVEPDGAGLVLLQLEVT